MVAAWGRQDTWHCQTRGNTDTALKAGGRNGALSPSRRASVVPCLEAVVPPVPPGPAWICWPRCWGQWGAGAGGCRHTRPVVVRCPVALPLLCEEAEAAQPRLVLLLPCRVLKLADVQQKSNSSGKEELPDSSNSRDSYHALSESNKTTQIDLLHNDSKNC